MLFFCVLRRFAASEVAARIFTMRNTRVGSVQAAVRDVYTAFGGLEAIREATGISVTTLSYGTEQNETRPGGLGVNYLDTICRMEPQCAVALASHFAALAGGVFQPVDRTGDDECLVVGTQRLSTENGQALSAVVGAIGSQCPRAVEAAIEEIDDAVEVNVAIKAILERKRATLR